MFSKNETFFPYQVQKCIKLSESIFEVYFIPLGATMNYQPGQICKIHCSDEKERFYSIVNHPSESEGIVIHFRSTPHTNSAIAKIKKEKTVVRISGPYGTIHSVLNKNKPRILYAEGLGISAFHSLIDDKKIIDQETHVIWIKDQMDDIYSSLILDKWYQHSNALKVSLFDREKSSFTKSLNYCGNIFQRKKQVVMAFAGSLKTSNYLKDELLSKYQSDKVEYVSDV